MAGTSLLALIDDIATLLDDVAALSKTAATKTAGVLGDDLALNAEQLTGIRPERELPVVWKVFRGSALNKLLLVPVALALSAFLPWLIAPLLMAGGAYLCFEGFEKVAHSLQSSPKQDAHATVKALSQKNIDIVEFEKDKIKGAIFTDFILSAEIVVIALGSVQQEPLMTQAMVLTVIAAGLTIGVYALVAAIVKLDDVGLALAQADSSTAERTWGQRVGSGILWFAPRFLKTLGIVGTAAMFLVGGGIWAHGIPPIAHWLHGAEHLAGALPHVGLILGSVVPMLVNAGLGILVGGLAVLVVHFGRKLVAAVKPA